MIPAPLPDVELPNNAADALRTALVPGILSSCCACGQGTIWHWLHGDRYYPLHGRQSVPTNSCAERVVDEWREAIAAGRSDVTAPTGRLTGAYARRASGIHAPRRHPASIGRGSPLFRPGVPDGAPWVATARQSEGGTLLCPSGFNEAHARAVNERWRLLAVQGWLPLVSGHVVDPTGAISGAWQVG
jgi:hypothetical protein